MIVGLTHFWTWIINLLVNIELSVKSDFDCTVAAVAGASGLYVCKRTDDTGDNPFEGQRLKKNN